MKLDMVGRTPGELLGLQRDILERLSGHEGDLWMERYKRMHQGQNPFAELVGVSAPTDAWKDELVASVRKKLGKFSSAWAKQVTPVPDLLTPQFITNAAAYNMRPVFFPEADIGKTFRHKKYIKPEQGYYDQVRSGEITGGAPTQLRPGWYLADFSKGVDYTDGTQVFPGDPWTHLITGLRQKKEVGDYDSTPSGSRFAITWDEWNYIVLGYMASKLGVCRAQISLERALEFNFIGNVYDNKRGCFRMWEWFQDAFMDSRRTIGGNRVNGGLANVSCGWQNSRYSHIAGRPLVSLVQ